MSYLDGLPLESLHLLTEILICLYEEKVSSTASGNIQAIDSSHKKVHITGKEQDEKISLKYDA